MAKSERVAPLDDDQTSQPSRSNYMFKVVDVCLRFLLFVLSLIAVVVGVNSKQTEQVPVMLPNMQSPIFVAVPAKFYYTPAVIYLVVALSVAGLYGIITSLFSLSYLLKSKSGFSMKLLSQFVIIDLLLFGIVICATGASGSIAYTGLKGNSHIGWQRVCNTFDKFCWRVGTSIVLSLFASIDLLLLVLLSIYVMSKKNPK